MSSPVAEQDDRQREWNRPSTTVQKLAPFVELVTCHHSQSLEAKEFRMRPRQLKQRKQATHQKVEPRDRRADEQGTPTPALTREMPRDKRQKSVEAPAPGSQPSETDKEVSETWTACFGWLTEYRGYKRFLQSGVATKFMPYADDIGEYSGAVFSGFVVSSILYSISAKEGMEFVNENITHVKPMLIVFGFFLVGLSMLLTGWPPSRCLGRVLVLPFLRVCHHLFLVGGGALLALLLFAGGAASSAAPVILWGLGILLVGGAEFQIAIRYCEMSEKNLAKFAPIWLRIGAGILVVFLIGRLVLREAAKIQGG